MDTLSMRALCCGAEGLWFPGERPGPCHDFLALPPPYGIHRLWFDCPHWLRLQSNRSSFSGDFYIPLGTGRMPHVTVLLSEKG